MTSSGESPVLPDARGVYDIAARPVYVGEGGNIRSALAAVGEALVQTADCGRRRIHDEKLRRQVRSSWRPRISRRALRAVGHRHVGGGPPRPGRGSASAGTDEDERPSPAAREQRPNLRQRASDRREREARRRVVQTTRRLPSNPRLAFARDHVRMFSSNCVGAFAPREFPASGPRSLGDPRKPRWMEASASASALQN